MLRLWLSSCALISAATVVVVLGFLLHASWPLLQQAGIPVIWQREWYPYEALFGMAPALVGSLWSIALALLIALPLGVAAALFNIEIVPPPLQGTVRLAIELMAGIPSVVYGLLGLWILVPLLEGQLNLLTGRTLLAAGLLLAMMILPTIMVFSEEALRGVAKAQRESAANLGLDWPQRMLRILLPQAWPGIRIATLLATGRALGETVAVMLVVGSIDRLPEPFYDLLQPAQTLTARIGREMSEASIGSLHWAALMTSGLTFALVTVLISLAAHRTGQRP